MRLHIKIIAILLMSSFLFISCSDDESNPVDGDNGSSTTINGRVTDNNGYGNGLEKVAASVEGAIVTTAEIQSNGTITTTSEASVETNSNGEFEIVTNSEGKSNVVVIATKGSNEWKAMVSAEVESKKENHTQPLNMETTAEVDVYIKVVADGKSNTVTYADVAFYVNAQIAADIKNNVTTSTEVKNAIVAKVEAEKQVLVNSYYGYSNADYEKAKKVDEDAQKAFELEMYLNSDTEVSYKTAWENYFNAKVSGYSNTSIMLSHFAQAEEISGKTMLEFNTSLNSETRLELVKRNAYLKAMLIAEAMVKEYEKAGADAQAKQAVAEINADLLVAIRNSTSINALDQAYANYKTSIATNLKVSFESMASAFTVINTTIEAGIKTTLEAAISASTNAQALMNAYTTFFGSVNTTVSSELSIGDNTQLDAFVNIYALIYMHN